SSADRRAVHHPGGMRAAPDPGFPVPHPAATCTDISVTVVTLCPARRAVRGVEHRFVHRVPPGTRHWSTVGLAMTNNAVRTQRAEKTGTEKTGSAEAEGRLRPRLPVLTGAWADVAAIVAYLVGAVWVTARLWTGFGRVLLAANPDDNSYGEWMVSNDAHAVAHLANPLYTALLNAPDGVDLMGNTPY